VNVERHVVMWSQSTTCELLLHHQGVPWRGLAHRNSLRLYRCFWRGGGLQQWIAKLHTWHR